MPKSLTFFVAGEPQAQPKTIQSQRGRGGSFFPRNDDPKGHKAAWAELIVLAAKRARIDWEDIHRGETFYFTRRHPVAVGIQVFLTQAKSNKDKYPVIAPDLDNVQYTPHNVFQGIFYDDDCQIVQRVPLEGKWWWGVTYVEYFGKVSTIIHSNSPGMRITVREVVCI